MGNSKQPQRDPLGDTWPEELDGVPATERQIEYLMRHIERLERQMPSEEDMAYLRRKKQEDEHVTYLWALTKRHAPWVAAVAAMLSWAVTYILTHNFHVSSK